MPFRFGNIYPEVESSGFLNKKFRVLIDVNDEPEVIDDFIIDALTLRSYLSDIDSTIVDIDLFLTQELERFEEF